MGNMVANAWAGLRKRRAIVVAVFLAVVGAAAVWLAARVPFSSEILRSRVIATLRDRLDAEVELGAVTLRVLPQFEVRGENLVIRHRGRRDVPPLFSADAFTVRAR